MNFIYPFALPIALSLTAYNAFLTGLMVLLKRKDEVGIRYFISSFVIFVWGVGITFMLNNELPASTAQSWGIFAQVVAVFIPPTWLHFVLIYTEMGKYKKVLYLAYLVSAIIFPFTFTKHFVAGFHPAVSVHQYPIPGVAYIAFTVLFVVVVTFSFLLFGKAILAARLLQKKKDYKLVCLASLYGFGMGALSFLPVYGVPFPQYNLLLMPIWQILLTYAMIRYQVFDIEEFVKAAHKEKLAAIGTLATSLNHEIKNPLYVIRGFAESYLEKLKDGGYKNHEEAIHKSREVMTKTVEQTTRAMEIMRRFSVFAKQSVNEQAQKELVHLDKVLDDIVPLVNHELELDKIQLVRDLSKDLQPFHADRRHVEEILFNLIVNACQAMKDGGEIRISAAQQNGTFTVGVEDNGPGISPDHLKQIFQPFYTTKREGTGLGLYVVKQLVERNGGKISVKSKLGKGTSFSLEFKR